jgi:hypothetical protein
VGEGGVTPLGRSLQNDQEWFPPEHQGGGSRIAGNVARDMGRRSKEVLALGPGIQLQCCVLRAAERCRSLRSHVGKGVLNRWR